MYRTLAYPIGLRRLPYCGIVVNDIIGDADGALFDIILQRNTPLRYLFSIVWRISGGYDWIEGADVEFFTNREHDQER